MSDRSISKWYDPLLFGIFFPILTILVKILYRTNRMVEVEGVEKKDAALSKSGGRAIYASWHQRVLFPVSQLMNQGVTVMVSRSRDGEYAAQLLRHFGLRNVRGSSTRGGSEALKELVREIMEGSCGGMVVDGPLGPPRVAKVGAAVMARDAQVPIIPLSYGADRCWVFNSWDRFMIPKPFARVSLCYAEPIWVPPSADGEELESFRRLLEERLNKACKWCDEQFGQERPWQK